MSKKSAFFIDHGNKSMVLDSLIGRYPVHRFFIGVRWVSILQSVEFLFKVFHHAKTKKI